MRLVDGPPPSLTSPGDAWPPAAGAAPAAGAITRRLDGLRISTLSRLSGVERCSRCSLFLLVGSASFECRNRTNRAVSFGLLRTDNFRFRSFHPTDHATPHVVQPLFWLPYPCSRIWHLGCRRGSSSGSLWHNPFCLEVWLSFHRHCLGVCNREAGRRSNPRKRDPSARSLYHYKSVCSLPTTIFDAKLESYA